MPPSPTDTKALTIASISWTNERTSGQLPQNSGLVAFGGLSDPVRNFGQRNWPVISQNTPSPAANTAWAGAASTRGAAGPGTPSPSGYRIRVKNLMGNEVMRIVYRVTVACGPDVTPGGLCVARAQVVPLAIEAAWGWKASLEVFALPAQNAGTADAPIAMLPLQLKLAIETSIKSAQAGVLHTILADRGLVD